MNKKALLIALVGSALVYSFTKKQNAATGFSTDVPSGATPPYSNSNNNPIVPGYTFSIGDVVKSSVAITAPLYRKSLASYVSLNEQITIPAKSSIGTIVSFRQGSYIVGFQGRYVLINSQQGLTK